MNQSAEGKLNELRSKTNRQLVSLIGNKLDRGLAFARMLDGDSADWKSAEHFGAVAAKDLADATAWMSLLNGVTQLERRRLEFKLTQLRETLAHTHVSEMRVQAAC